MNKLRTLKAVMSTYGIIEIFRLIRRKLSNTESVTEFGTGVRWGSAAEFLHVIGVTEATNTDDLDSTTSHRSGFFDSVYDLGPELSRSLIALISSVKPALLIETGVAAGKSTNIILQNLGKNSKGRLVSVDITRNVGELVEKENRKSWKLEVLPSFGRKKRFRKILMQNREAVIFLHDSDHSVKWQEFEVLEVLASLPSLSYLLIDDIQPLVAEHLLEIFGGEYCFFFNEMNIKKSAVIITNFFS